ncbi:hypothetical protein PQI23_13350 [Leucobacter sp. USCH14]|uniref:hypothetical protein n=1 Tax=Leucobacter sp. USCH14 TaxID=3024838 RepID=UPI0030A6792B
MLPHRHLVAVAPLRGSNASGRVYHNEVVIPFAQIVDGAGLVGGQYAREANVTGVVYCDRDAFDALPMPDSKVRLWAGTGDEHEAVVMRVERYNHPRIADLIVLVLR